MEKNRPIMATLFDLTPNMPQKFDQFTVVDSLLDNYTLGSYF